MIGNSQSHKMLVPFAEGGTHSSTPHACSNDVPRVPSTQCGQVKAAISSLRTILVPLDLHDTWNRLIDDLEEPDSDTDRSE